MLSLAGGIRTRRVSNRVSYVARYPGRVAAGLGAAGVLYRVVLVLTGLPQTNSDEATMGLMARHILAGVRAPVFFYGQHYMGALEAYLAVPVFAVVDSSTVALRVSAIVMYAAFLAAMYHLVRELFSPWFAVAITGLLALGSDRVVKDELIAGGGYPEINLLAAALLLLAVHLARTPRGPWWYAAFGLGAGLALWSDYLVAPYLAGAVAVLLLGRKRGLWAAAVGLLAGLAPVIAHDLTTAPRDRSLRVLFDLSRAGQDQLAGTSPADHLHGGVLVGVPMATGLCRPSVCDAPTLAWGAILVALLVVAAVLAVRQWRGDPVVHCGRLVLALAGLATVVLYARSPAAVLTPIESARYLSCLLISVPVALWPLWTVAARRTPVAVPAAALLLAVAATSTLATVLVPAQPRDRTTRPLVEALDRAGIRAFYSDYWTCGRVVFATRERLTCAVLGDDLRAGFDRYRPYRDAVAAAPDAAYALPIGSTVDRAFAAHLAAAGIPARTEDAAGYRIYRPATPAGVPLP